MQDFFDGGTIHFSDCSKAFFRNSVEPYNASMADLVLMLLRETNLFVIMLEYYCSKPF